MLKVWIVQMIFCAIRLFNQYVFGIRLTVSEQISLNWCVCIMQNIVLIFLFTNHCHVAILR